MDNNIFYKRNHFVRSTNLNNSFLLIEGGKTYEINDVGFRIWSLCDGNNALSDITKVIVEEYAEDQKNIVQDIISFLEELNKLNFVNKK